MSGAPCVIGVCLTGPRLTEGTWGDHFFQLVTLVMKTELNCAEVKDMLQTPAEDVKRDESAYMDLELVRAGGADLEKECGFSEGKQISVIINNDGAVALRAQIDTKERAAVPFSCAITHPEKGEDHKNAHPEEELNSGDNYLSGRSESDDYEDNDDVSLVLSDESTPCVTEDESHYITTHEIQLSELSDHEGDCDIGVGSSTSWDLEDDTQVYSLEGRQPGSEDAPAAVSSLTESDPARFASSDESVSKPQQQQQQQQQQDEQERSGTSAGQIHLSIRTTSRAINDPGTIQEQGSIHHARRAGDMSRYVFRGVDGKADTLCDGAKCFIAAPGRLHFGGKLRRKEATEPSSGASSAVSELDDADKEVRNLTDRAFKSLAHPYLDAIHFSTSSESSASEHRGMNRWLVKYGSVNMSQGLDQSVLSHQNAIKIAKNIDSVSYRGIALADPHNPSAKKIELMGNSGVIRLTETLKFRCNVQSGVSEGERRTKFAQNAAGSRSTDEITDGVQSGQSRGASQAPRKTMEDPHKKAIFASSVIKNVISKKMQFEQERKMERGEIREPQRVPPPGFTHQEKLLRQNSRVSESSEDHIMCVDELGDFVDSGSCDRQATETNLDEGGIETKKGAFEASKSTLLRSQNSAFRCWKDEEVEFQKDRKNDKSAGERLPSADGGEDEADRSSAGAKATKMSHLFVPSIQLQPPDGGQQLQADGDGRGLTVRSDNTLHITDSRNVATSKSPEIKINLRSARDNKTQPPSVSKLRAPNIGCNAASSLIGTDDFKCQALTAALRGECSDKVPHFTVRDIRDNKGKLQTPIHQVRDVRKLVKSSYHFVSLDNNEQKSSAASADSQSEQKMSRDNPDSVSPIVIKYQSVNTNSNDKQQRHPESLEMDTLSSEGAKSAPPQRAAARALIDVSHDSSEGDIQLKTESRAASNKQEKTSDIIAKKPDLKMANQAALEKLQAAVKTMEQLYVFEKNEWKRKNEPRPLTDSHVLPLLAIQEHGGPEGEGARGPIMDKAVRRDSYPNTSRSPPAGVTSPSIQKDIIRTPQTSSSRSVHATGSKSMFSLSSSLKAVTSATTSLSNAVTQMPFSAKNIIPKSPKLPVSLKISRSWLSENKGAESMEAGASARELSSTSADNKNYLTIPVKSHPANSKQPPSAEKTSVYSFSTPTIPPGHVGSGTRGHDNHNQTSSIVMETRSPEVPSTSIYHSLPVGMSASQPQVYCFSPAITPGPSIDPYQAIQRKMLLDPSTGNYYLVDTPVQPATKRLFDPETGQYIDVPMPQPPMTPVHVPIPHLALSPGTYGPTYMLYPSFMSTPSVIPARTMVQSQMSVQSEADSGEKVQQTEGMYMEGPFYMATRKSPKVVSGAPQQATTFTASRPPYGFSSIKQPVISITSQQGPHIIAPPSFDGTTMSFVVEHR